MAEPRIAMFHVQTGKGALNTVAVNPLHVVCIASPSGAKGMTPPPYNTVITVSQGPSICALEPRDVVMALNGRAAMDTAGNPGYYHAVPDITVENEWAIRRTDYPE